jgi:LacI family transcriptional regulator
MKRSNAARIPMVAVLVETSLAAGRDILTGIATYVRQHSPWMMYITPHHITTPPPPWFKDWKGDGIIVRLHNERIAQAVEDKNVPVVDVLGLNQRHPYPVVHTDNRAVGRMAANHLHERGFVNFGFLGISDENWAIERQRAYAERLGELGHECHALVWTEGSEKRVSFSRRVERIRDWLLGIPHPTAIFVSDDPRTLFVRDAIREAGLTVGGDVAVLGVGNDSLLCNLFAPALSSIDADHQRVGYEAAATLDAMMKGERIDLRPRLIPPRDVVVRESTDFLAVEDDVLRKAMAYIRQHAVEGIGVEDVVQACHASRSVIQRRFRQALKQSVHECIAQERVRRAIQLIRETNDSIESIAEAAGFQYVQSLNKTLRSLYGRSASDYRSRFVRDNVPGI